MAADPQRPRSAWRSLRRLRPDPRAIDAVVVVVVFLASVFVSGESGQDLAIRALGDVPLAAVLVSAVASCALVWRRHRPLEVLGVNLVGSVLLMVTDHAQLFALGFALYSAGRYATNHRWSVAGVGTAMVLAAVDGLRTGTAFDTAGGVLVVFALWYAGRRVRYRDDREALLAREQAAQAQRVLAEERARIARELHDVVAHRVSLMTVQAGAAKTVAAVNPQGAVQAMAAVEQAGREALDELRHLLGVLRPDAEPEGLSPQPGLADVPQLVDQFKDAGLDVSLKMEGTRTDVPARVDLFSYRIVQEAMTNVLKHAGPGTRTEVRLHTNNHHVAIEVLDRGHGPTVLPGSGHGIVGMRERALLVGGRLEAGPRSGGGFQVIAHLPLGQEPA